MFRIEIETGNAAFEDDPHFEVARILRRVADTVAEGYNSGLCHDVNGNRVGTWALRVAS